jgi:hypothetical protein
VDFRPERALGVKRAPWKALACALAHSISFRQSESAFKEVIALFAENTDSAFAVVNSDWDRTDLGFSIASILSTANLKRAYALMSTAHDTRGHSLVPDGRTAASYVQAVRLAIRAFIGLLPRELDVKEALERLRKIINSLPSEGERARLWSELALRCFAAKKKDLGIDIVNAELRAVTNNITDEGFRDFIMPDIAPALYYAHPVSAIRDLSKLDETHRSTAFENICRFILYRLPMQEPPPRGAERLLTTSEVDDYLECLTHIVRDSALGFYVEKLTRSLLSSDGVKSFSRAYRAEVGRRIRETVSPKVPWKHGITHQGYPLLLRVCTTALAAEGLDIWQQLAMDCRQIPNLADRVLVLGCIVSFASGRHDAFRKEVLNEARQLALQIPAPLDRLERLLTLGDFAEPFDLNAAKECLADAFKLSLTVKQDVGSQQRTIIDRASRISDEFAKSLLAQMEDDPAIKKRKRLKARSELNRILKQIPKEFSEETIAHLSPRETSELCGMMLSGLYDGSVSTVPAKKISILMNGVRVLPFRQAYVGLAWAIENSTVSYAHTPYGTSHMLDMFTACANACQLGIQLMSRSAGYQFGLTTYSSSSETGGMISPGERSKAFRIITDWLQANKPETLKICDPYFSPPDLEILRVVLDTVPQCRVKILAGEKKHKELHVPMPYDTAYAEEWKKLSRHNPPETDIVIAGLSQTMDCPVHERWIIARGAGLRMGGSFSGLGGARLTEISPLSDVESKEAILDEYLNHRVRESDGQRVRYFGFSLY